MLNKISPILGWKNLLATILFISATISQASTITADKMEGYVVYEDAKVVSGDNNFYTGYFNASVNLKETGTYQATLSDFNFPVNFDLLGLSISSSTEKIGEVWGNGSFNFEADAGKYFMGLIYKTNETLNLGMYGVDLRYVNTSAVPLPASLWLMLTGIMAIVSYQRKQ